MTGRNRRKAPGTRERVWLRPRHVPQRTCVACRQVAGKRTLVRIVRTPEGSVEVDPTGKRNGRGAYLHADPACWDLALKRNVLQHALKTELSEYDRAGLEAYRAGLQNPVSGSGFLVSSSLQPEARNTKQGTASNE